MIDLMTRTFRRTSPSMVAFLGTTVVLLGVVMIALPGPGLFVITAGLAILATKFQWARILFFKIRLAIETFKTVRKHQ